MNFQPLLDLIFPPQCAACDAIGAGICTVCVPETEPLQRNLATLRVRAAGAYAGELRRCILALKNGRRDVARSGAQRLQRLISSPCTLVPVPTTPVRRRERGFDGCVLMAKLIAQSIPGVNVLHGLRQTRGDRQRGRTRAARLAARGRFVWRGETLTGMTLVLLDDVVTTGSTLEDCARALRNEGAFVSHAVALALTP